MSYKPTDAEMLLYVVVAQLAFLWLLTMLEALVR